MATSTIANRAPSHPAAARLASIDLLRGAVMVLMAIDHVRVYAGVPAGGPDPAVFFTRWVTHFCAPAFIFLAGTSAFFYGTRDAGPGPKEGKRGVRHLQSFLVTRGLWLILLELTLLRVAWTFNLNFAGYNMAGVIWVIGWCLILLALLVRLPLGVIGAFGVLMIGAHNVLDPLLFSSTVAESPLAGLWKILYIGFYAGPVSIGDGGPPLWVLYSIVPWVGVMAAGYAFGAVLIRDAGQRRRVCLAVGLGAVGLFLLLRGFNLYGNPQPWSAAQPGGDGQAMPAALSFLNTNKYPASLSFLLMTLGPIIALIPLVEQSRGAVARWRSVSRNALAAFLEVFGRVPFFYYVLHIPLIHLLAIGVSLARTGRVDPWLFADHPMGAPPPPDGYMWSLGLLYVVWAVALVLLYYACRWFADLKARRREWWLRYV